MSISDYTFMKLRKCRYEKSEIVEGQVLESATIDFKKFRNLLPANPRTTRCHMFAAEPGFCSPESDCVDLFLCTDTVTHFAFDATEIPLHRLNRAPSYLFKEFCDKEAEF